MKYLPVMRALVYAVPYYGFNSKNSRTQWFIDEDLARSKYLFEDIYDKRGCYMMTPTTFVMMETEMAKVRKNVTTIEVPMLFFEGTGDETVCNKAIKTAFNQSMNQESNVYIEIDGDHNTMFYCPEFCKQIADESRTFLYHALGIEESEE